MILSKLHKILIFKSRHPDRLTATIPTAKKFEHEGQTLVAVPHRIDEVRVLRNMGYAVAPSPVKFYYDWPGRYPKPFHAQEATTEFVTLNSRGFILNELGTGKTLALLWAFDYLRRLGKVRKLLVIAPLSTLERTWADEVFSSFPEWRVNVLHGSKERRLKLLNDDADVYVINHDGIKVIADEIIAKPDLDMICIDEIATFRNAQTELWKAANRVIAGRPRVYGMTGTPTPEEPADAWAQCRLLAPERVPKYFGLFRDSVMVKKGQFKWLARAGANDIVAEAMQPAVRFKRSDCTDLPPCLYQTREVAMTPAQADAYRDMLTRLKMEFAGQQVLAVNQAVKLGKLLQIGQGCAYGRNGVEVMLPTEPRIKETVEIIRQAGAKVIVFVTFTAALKYVAEELAKHFTVAIISGQVSAAKRAKIFKEFQDGRDPHVLVAQPDAMSHGLTLTRANTIIWYGPTHSNETYEQANGRITRPGQKLSQLIVHLEASPAERKVFSRLQNKQKMQGLLLDLLRDA